MTAVAYEPRLDSSIGLGAKKTPHSQSRPILTVQGAFPIASDRRPKSPLATFSWEPVFYQMSIE